MMFTKLPNYQITKLPNYQITNSQHRYISHHFANNTLVLTTFLGQLTMTALHNNAISIVFDPQDSDVPATHLPSFAI